MGVADAAGSLTVYRNGVRLGLALEGGIEPGVRWAVAMMCKGESIAVSAKPATDKSLALRLKRERPEAAGARRLSRSAKPPPDEEAQPAEPPVDLLPPTDAISISSGGGGGEEPAPAQRERAETLDAEEYFRSMHSGNLSMPVAW
jgi:hypothetical protein